MSAAVGFAQERVVQGVVKQASNQLPLPGVTVQVKGTQQGTVTGIDGKFMLSVPEGNNVLTFRLIGMEPLVEEINNRASIEVSMKEEVTELDEVVVTALGVTRDKRSLGDAVQEVSGSSVSEVPQQNMVNSLSGKVAGLQVQASGVMGGSTNVIIRGQSSLGNNQALFVVDGVPIDNSSTNSSYQNQGSGGIDWGSPIADINPEDIASISVLKGASAAALYGSRGSNGVVMITTKNGSGAGKTGVDISTGVIFSQVNQRTLPRYQKEYGAGYPVWQKDANDNWYRDYSHTYVDVDGDGTDEVFVNFGDDASWGPKFDGSPVIHWDALDPVADNYLETRPWVASENGPEAFFQTGRAINTNVALTGSGSYGNYRISYTNRDETGIIPNSVNKKNNFNVAAKFDFTDRLSSSVNMNYSNRYVRNRPAQGYDAAYSRAFMASSAFWMQTNVDFERLKNYQMSDGTQYTWNRSWWNDPSPAYWDNPYWVVYKNFTEDTRERIFGAWSMDYRLTDWLTLTGKYGLDTYTDVQEERIANGSYADFPYYYKTNRNRRESNLDFILSANKQFGKVSLNAFVGTNYRHNQYERIGIGTDQGFTVDNVFWAENSSNPETYMRDYVSQKKMFSVYASATLGYKDMLFVDLKGRMDQSSTLPLDNNTYFYPATSLSFIFTELQALQYSNIISYGKLRASYGRVGSDTDPYRLVNTLGVGNYGTNPAMFSSSTVFDPNLRPEFTDSWEVGTDLSLFNNRVRADFTYFYKSTYDQIVYQAVPASTGVTSISTNIGEIENKGVELSLGITPVQTGDFRWDMNVNWSSYRNKVIDIDGDPETNNGVLEYGSSYDYASVVAKEGEAMGAIIATNFVYNDKGEKLVDANGYYQLGPQEVLGNANPDWIGGLQNTFTYKSWTLNTLLDASWGGERFSLTHFWGKGTGVLEETVGTNELGNPIRSNPNEGGGVVLEGVTEDGKPNEVRLNAYDAFAYWRLPAATAVVDASYVKLREVSLTYQLPARYLTNTPFQKLGFSLIGSNLAILKGPKHFDPETTYGAGNTQGIEQGALPTPRSYGFKVNLGF
ncbi:SusC/RagA family TonB-linked outer membrane protein [Algivirga pacifica]|uniref:SusC/RagA family TonB-linked outer membrane protein n=2 Tax=Algivirga pacifica TaxID=1162670 RepID=A0ABP9D4T1_9BACT